LADWLKVIEENKELLLLTFSFLVLLPSSLIAYFTYKSMIIARERMKEETPIIADVAYQDKDKIKIIVCNNKPSNITLKTIEIKKKQRLFFIKEKIKWTPSKSKVSTSPIAGVSYKNIQHFTIKYQEDFYITIPNIKENSIYKICVETTGGACHHISRLPVRGG